MHRGVYAVGHRALRRDAWWTGAVPAAGPGAALSHRSAAELWGLRAPSRPRIEVSAPRHRRSTALLQLHCVVLQADEVTVEGGIAVTTPARTLLDLAAVVLPHHLEAAFNEAEFRRLHGELDAIWYDQRLIVECDGFAAHGTRRAFEDDRARDRELVAAGWRVVRITWRQLTEDGDTIARQLRTLLTTHSTHSPNAPPTWP